MTEPATFDPNNLKLQPLGPPEGLLEQFNLPPKLIAFIRRNQRGLWAACIAVVVLSLGGAGVNAYRDHRAQQAASALDAALLAPKDNKTLLEKVAAEYESTDSALWAKVELAGLSERAGQTTTSISDLQSINSALAAKSPFKPLLLNKLAALYEDEHQLDKALALYTELSSWEYFAAEAYRALGRVNEQLGKKEDAVAMYSKYLDSESSQTRQGQGNPVREMVQSRLNQLKK
ncbi:MAG: tetratricopeptide repeat protein [Desulfobulbus sp.]|nr:tetratricopeptide repeat protein [Desulfobulbus sp.]